MHFAGEGLAADTRVDMVSPPPKSDEWVWNTVTSDGAVITVRPLRKNDEQREIDFIASLSERSRHFRMFAPLRFLTPQLLSQFMDVDYDRRVALVATVGSGCDERFVGVARYAATDRPGSAELGITVTDAWQRRGVATILLRALARFAVGHGFHELTGIVLPENHAMLEFARSLGFAAKYDPVDHVMKISHDLGSESAAADSSA